MTFELLPNGSSRTQVLSINFGRSGHLVPFSLRQIGISEKMQCRFHELNGNFEFKT